MRFAEIVDFAVGLWRNARANAGIAERTTPFYKNKLKSFPQDIRGGSGVENILWVIVISGIAIWFFSSPSTKTQNQTSAQSTTTQEGLPNKPADQLDPLDQLAQSPEDQTLRPTGDLAEMFNLGSKNTDLQRDLKLQGMKNAIIVWTLPIYEIKRVGNNYRVQTSASKNYVGTFIELTAQNESEHQAMRTFNTGDNITIKGKLVGNTTMRNLDIKPAVLWSQQNVNGIPPKSPEWTVAGGNSEVTTYVDRTSIYRNGNFAKMWELRDYSKGFVDMKGIFRLSIRYQSEYDCNEKTTRQLAVTYFSGQMANGTVNYNENNTKNWEAIEPGFMSERLWKIACGKE